MVALLTPHAPADSNRDNTAPAFRHGLTFPQYRTLCVSLRAIVEAATWEQPPNNPYTQACDAIRDVLLLFAPAECAELAIRHRDPRSFLLALLGTDLGEWHGVPWPRPGDDTGEWEP